MKSYVTHLLTTDYSIDTVHLQVLKNTLLQCKACYHMFINLIFTLTYCIIESRA